MTVMQEMKEALKETGRNIRQDKGFVIGSGVLMASLMALNAYLNHMTGSSWRAYGSGARAESGEPPLPYALEENDTMKMTSAVKPRKEKAPKIVPVDASPNPYENWPIGRNIPRHELK